MGAESTYRSNNSHLAPLLFDPCATLASLRFDGLSSSTSVVSSSFASAIIDQSKLLISPRAPLPLPPLLPRVVHLPSELRRSSSDVVPHHAAVVYQTTLSTAIFATAFAIASLALAPDHQTLSPTPPPIPAPKNPNSNAPFQKDAILETASPSPSPPARTSPPVATCPDTAAHPGSAGALGLAWGRREKKSKKRERK